MSDSISISNDLEIIQRVLNGDTNAFEGLVTKYTRYVMSIVYKHIPSQEAEEVAQDVFIRTFQSLKTFKQKSGFKPWLSAIAIRSCYDYWRKVYRSKEVPLSALSEKHQGWIETVLSSESGHVYNKKKQEEEAREVLTWALDHLSPEDRMVLELVYLEGYSGKEAARLLGWSVANVKIRSFRARKKLYKLLSGRDKR